MECGLRIRGGAAVYPASADQDGRQLQPGWQERHTTALKVAMPQDLNYVFHTFWIQLKSNYALKMNICLFKNYMQFYF